MITKEKFISWLHDDSSSVLYPEGCTHVLFKISCNDSVYLYIQKCTSERPAIAKSLEYMALYDRKSRRMIGTVKNCFRGFLAPECQELIECDDTLINVAIKARVDRKIRDYAKKNERKLMEKAQTFIMENGLQSYFSVRHEARHRDIEHDNYLLGYNIILDVPAYDYTVKTDSDIYAYLHDEEAFIQNVFEEFVTSYDSCIYPFGEEKCHFGFEIALGLNLIAYQEAQIYLAKLKNGCNRRLVKRRDIISASKDLYRKSEGDIVNVKVLLRKKSTTAEFSYPLEYLTMGMTPLTAVSGTVKKKSVSEFISPESPHDFDMNSIYRIMYRNQVIYSDDQSLE